jgi:hypothetical protein
VVAAGAVLGEADPYGNKADRLVQSVFQAMRRTYSTIPADDRASRKRRMALGSAWAWYIAGSSGHSFESLAARPA